VVKDRGEDMNEEKILYKEECYQIQGAIFEVYREMGCGFLESVYQECLLREFSDRIIPFIAQKELSIFYKSVKLEQIYKPDFICFDKIILELKAVKELLPEHEAQLFNYLKATGLKMGMLINFGHYPKAQIKRIVI
jgi:GxxExxY protein